MAQGIVLRSVTRSCQATDFPETGNQCVCREVNNAPTPSTASWFHHTRHSLSHNRYSKAPQLGQQAAPPNPRHVHGLIHPPQNHSRSQSLPQRFTSATNHFRNDSLPQLISPATNQCRYRNESLSGRFVTATNHSRSRQSQACNPFRFAIFPPKCTLATIQFRGGQGPSP